MSIDLKQMINWFTLRGVLFILAGIVMILFSQDVIQVILAVIGVYTIIIALKFTGDLFNQTVTKLDRWAIVELVLLIALGIILIVYREDVLSIIGDIVAVFALLAGILQVIFALSGTGRLRLFVFLSGMLSVILSAALFIDPREVISNLLGIIIGAYLITSGILFFVLSSYFRKLQKKINNDNIIER